MVVLTLIERETLQVFLNIFHRRSMCPPLVIRQTSMRQSISFHTRVSISRSTRATVAVCPSGKQGKYVRGLFLKNNFNSFSLYRRKNYHDPLRSPFVANFLNVSRIYEQLCINLRSEIGVGEVTARLEGHTSQSPRRNYVQARQWIESRIHRQHELHSTLGPREHRTGISKSANETGSFILLSHTFSQEFQKGRKLSC